MKVYLLLLLALCLGTQPVLSQVRDTVAPAKIYRVKPLLSLPVTAAGFYFSQKKLADFREKPSLTQADLDRLDPNDVPGIDRWGLRQNPAKAESYAKISDVFFITGQLAPFTLFAWKKYRDEWEDITIMYLEAQMLQGMFYGYAPFGPASIDRLRPRAYYEETEFSLRTNGNTQNSAFSGHVSTTATGWYFYAKIITDHNPDLTGGQKALIYTAATVPGAVTGLLRVKALKHFPTDSAIGLGVGAFSGIMVPEFHRWWEKRHRTRAMLTPLYGNGAAGAAFTLVF
ncbi:phosphatase PAP2 family protein [Neolewinella lacunae]|uniref:Phosphatase PAP2 family protein n=1 Tax=Neolewinella lacunae TaxID=1517758 RepID=A0A923T6V0_9BACT|nr:phosphatase PAP2 family protein [Neolewinella lacunae]MBC6992966.1 phosphatase PAP2 family protein [Neolewinella lacunae]MDN3633895.1 phosphatase PAP2 family protein [Neolewinella lacunae]